MLAGGLWPSLRVMCPDGCCHFPGDRVLLAPGSHVLLAFSVPGGCKAHTNTWWSSLPFPAGA